MPIFNTTNAERSDTQQVTTTKMLDLLGTWTESYGLAVGSGLEITTEDGITFVTETGETLVTDG